MNLLRPDRSLLIQAAGFFVLPLLLLGTGCEIESKDLSRSVNIQVSGRYTGLNGNRLVEGNSGAGIDRLDLQQQGSRLHGIDNNGTGYSGTVRRVEGSTAHIRLDGTTTAGAAFTLPGAITVTGTTARLNGTWIEAHRNGGVEGTATVPPAPVPNPDAR